VNGDDEGEAVMFFNDPPLGTEPCPDWAKRHLSSPYPDGSGSATWLEAWVGAHIAKTRPGLAEQLLTDLSEALTEGPDDEGQFRVTACKRATGRQVDCFDVHWKTLWDG
jgi:hypothetical protein